MAASSSSKPRSIRLQILAFGTWVDTAGVEKVYALLRAAQVDEAGNWSRRFKDNQAKMISGDVYKVAEVVRDVWRREQDKGISAGEKAILGRARQILISELALARDISPHDVETELFEVLQPPSPSEAHQTPVV